MSEKQNNNKQINNFTIKEAINNIDDNNNKRKIYEFLWGDNKFFKDEDEDRKVQKVFDTRHSVYSCNSYAFQIKDSKENIVDNKIYQILNILIVFAKN